MRYQPVHEHLGVGQQKTAHAVGAVADLKPLIMLFKTATDFTQ